MLLDALLDGPVDGPVAGLLISKDGVNWQLFKKLWPFGAMYTTLAALETGPGGVATKSVRLCRCAGGHTPLWQSLQRCCATV